MRNNTKYNQIIGVLKGGEIIVLDDTFKYDDGFKGATYYSMSTLTQDQIDNAVDEETVKDLVRDLWVEAVKAGNTEESLDDYAENMASNYEGYYFGDDPSFRSEMDEAYEALNDKGEFDKLVGVRGADFIDWTCGSCGRVGNSYKDWDFELLLRPDLIEKIKEFED